MQKEIIIAAVSVVDEPPVRGCSTWNLTKRTEIPEMTPASGAQYSFQPLITKQEGELQVTLRGDVCTGMQQLGSGE